MSSAYNQDGGFDALRFAKLHALATSIPAGYDNAIERSVARRKAQKIAFDAGFSFDEAARIIGALTQSPESAARKKAQEAKAEAWAEHVRTQQRREQEQKERADRAQRDREREQASQQAKMRMDAERNEQIARIWRKACPESKVEIALAHAARQFGIDPYAPYLDQSIAAEKTCRDAYPLPKTFAEAIAEIEALESAKQRRQAKVPKYHHGCFVELRRDMVLEFLTGRSATPDDAVKRADWIRTRGADLPDDHDLSVWMILLADDVMRIAKSLETAKDKLAQRRKYEEYRAARPAKPEKSTSAQKRKAINDILDQPGSEKLTLREIAERTGAHHSTVAEMRRKRQAQG